MKNLYLDYAATTPVDPRVAKCLQHYLTIDGNFANPASTHPAGVAAQAAIEQARCQIAALIQAAPKEIIFTSGATESNNLALFGVAGHYQSRGKHLISCQTEHKAILDPLNILAARGFEISYLAVNRAGLIDLHDLAEAIRPDTILVSIMHVNNETGVIQNIAEIAALTRQHNVRLHVDGAQSVGKLPLDLSTTPIDLLSIASHKVYGPKGIGALYVRSNPRVNLQALIYGGGQERRLRSGTLATHQIVAMGQALQLAPVYDESASNQEAYLAQQLTQGLLTLPGTKLNGCETQRYANICNISFEGVEGEALLMALQSELCVSSASACMAATTEPSHVLLAMGISPALAHASIRFSVGRFTTETEINQAIRCVHTHVERLRRLSPC